MATRETRDRPIERSASRLRGAPIPGFTLADADRLEGNSVRRVASWHGRADVSALAVRPVRLRWRMRDAQLHAFQFVP
jgi:hypothetical protein